MEGGRDPKSIAILAYIAPAERLKLQALEKAGADAAVMLLARQPESEALAELEQLAQRAL